MKTIKRLIPYLLFCVTALTAMAQEYAEKPKIKILNFEKVQNIHYNLAQEFARKTPNTNRDSVIWALLIVETNDPNIRVVSSEEIGFYLTEKLRENPRLDINNFRLPGQKWYSMRPGANKFRITHDRFRHDVELPELFNSERKHIGRIEKNWFIPISSIFGSTRQAEACTVYRLTIEVPQDYRGSIEPVKPANPGFVTFVTDPVGAVVTLLQNGETKASGKTNPDYSFSLEYGEYMYVVSAENHQSASGMVRISETPATKSVKLRPICGKLTVMSSPSGAEVTIGGVKYGVTPLNIDSIIIGEHEVTVSKAGYGETKEMVKITETDRAMINAQLSGSENLKPIPSTLTPKWAEGVTDEQKRILTELINSMVYVEGGTFRMGAQDSNPNLPNYQYKNVEKDEGPVHQVTLSGYHIGKYEVTKEQWNVVMGKKLPKKPEDRIKPKENVSWNDCQEFINALNYMTGLQFSLPTEAQWEYAARGGNKSKGYLYSGSDDIDNVAYYGKGMFGGTTIVGSKQPNELGLYDMSGNVWEWCQDWYGSYGSDSQTDPTGPTMGSDRVFRGGCWGDGAGSCRDSDRSDGSPDGSNSYLGLRLVCP